MFYKNTSYTEKTFYGVTFKPGETKEVTGHINSTCMIAVDKPVTSNKVQQKPSPEPTKEEALKTKDAEQESEAKVDNKQKDKAPEKSEDKKEQKA